MVFPTQMCSAFKMGDFNKCISTLTKYSSILLCLCSYKTYHSGVARVPTPKGKKNILETKFTLYSQQFSVYQRFLPDHIKGP
jgi:hypothetical protein